MLRDSENEEPTIPYFVWNVEMTHEQPDFGCLQKYKNFGFLLRYIDIMLEW